MLISGFPKIPKIPPLLHPGYFGGNEIAENQNFVF
jgi:hypothetical protein